MPTILPHVRSGKLKVLAVTSAQRTQLAPDLPTVAESAGLPGYEADVWYGLLAPAGTPPAIITKLNTEVGRVLQLPEIRDRLIGLGFEPLHTTPAQFAALMKSKMAKWEKVVKQSGAKVD